MGDGRRLGPSIFGRQVYGTCTCLRNPSFPFLFQPICPCLHLRELSILYLSQSLAGSWGSLTLSISCSFINKMSIARVVPASTLFDSVFPLLSVSGAQSEPASVDRQPHAHGDIGGHSPSGRQVRAPLSTSNIFYLLPFTFLCPFTSFQSTLYYPSPSNRHKQQMQDLVKQMETMQREYQLERQALRAQLLAVLQSQEVVPDLPLAALYSIPDASKYAQSVDAS